jgi:hypothetical protein
VVEVVTASPEEEVGAGEAVTSSSDGDGSTVAAPVTLALVGVASAMGVGNSRSVVNRGVPVASPLAVIWQAKAGKLSKRRKRSPRFIFCSCSYDR